MHISKTHGKQRFEEAVASKSFDFFGSYTLAKTVGKKSVYWLGGTDQNKEGQWEWVTGEPWSYSNWMSGEPNNWRAADGYENYLGMFMQWSWNDFSNGGSNEPLNNFGYICEWDTVPQSDRAYTLAHSLKRVTLDKPLQKNGTTDSDGDGLTDYKEVTDYLIQWNTDGSVKSLLTLGDAYMYISVQAYARFPKAMVAKMLNTKVLPVKSDPREKGSDGDGYLDGPKNLNGDGKINDPRPLKSDVITYKLSKSDFVPITNSNGVKYYGGSQGLMNDNNLVKNPDPVLNEGGCGIAAATDVLTYYERTKSRITKLPKLPNVHNIGISEYAERMVYMGMNHMKPIRILETLVAASTVLHGMSEIGNVYSMPIAAPPYRVLPSILGIWPIGSNVTMLS